MKAMGDGDFVCPSSCNEPLDVLNRLSCLGNLFQEIMKFPVWMYEVIVRVGEGKGGISMKSHC